MEIKTCEQYVLAQLFDQQDENDRIMAENDHLRSDVDELAGQVKTIEAFHESPIQQAIVEEGRRALLDRCAPYCSWPRWRVSAPTAFGTVTDDAGDREE